MQQVRIGREVNQVIRLAGIQSIIRVFDGTTYADLPEPPKVNRMSREARAPGKRATPLMG